MAIFSTALIVATMEYCTPVWGNLSKTKYDRLDRILVKAAKLFVRKNRRHQYHQKDKYYYLEKMN